jgi:hypothetical protein
MSYTGKNSGLTALQALQQGKLAEFVAIYNGQKVNTPENKAYVNAMTAGKAAYDNNATKIG